MRARYYRATTTLPLLPRLERLREYAALSQRELASRAGVAPSTITRLEKGAEAHPSTVRKLADALGVEPKELIEPT